MSDKDRQKKDGRDKNKKNQRKQGANAPQQAKAQSNLTDKEPGAASA